jgi:isopentenyl diphosphate isomerase/L-lactate dehydrogenase-like FMN-dependent dehydrogenase
MVDIASQIKSAADAQYYAERRVPKLIREYLRSGSGTRATLTANTSAFDQISFRPRTAVRHPSRDLTTRVLGLELPTPVMIAPTGGGRLAHPEGELAGARAAGSVGALQWVTTFAGYTIEEVMEVATGPVGFQLYYPGSREAAGDLIDRAKRLGCVALALTVDTAVGPRPENPAKGRITVYRAGSTQRRPVLEWLRIVQQFARKPGWTSAFVRDRFRGLYSAMVYDEGKPAILFRSSEILIRVTPVWEDLAWVKERWGGPLVIKGIQTPEDARRARDHGADGIIVSNHGGNVLDGNAGSVTVLPSIVDAVGDDLDVLFDSGIRRGTDVVKAMAIGAKAVLVGRSWLWAVAAAGEPGVRAMLNVYRQQIDETLASLGVASLAELDRSSIRFPRHWLEEEGRSA